MVERFINKTDLLTQNPNFWRVYADLKNPNKGYGVWYDVTFKEKEKQLSRMTIAEVSSFYEKTFGIEISMQPVEVRSGVKIIFYNSNRVNLIIVPAQGKRQSVIAEYERQNYMLVDYDTAAFGDIFFVDPNAEYFG